MVNWRLRLRSLFRRSDVDRELDEELAFYIDQRTQCHLAAGLSADEARLAARRDLGSIAHVKDQVRDARRVNLFEDVLQDVRYALRSFGRAPAFTAAALLTLALGIGASTAVFSVVYGVLLRPLPYPAADRWVRLWEEHPGGTPSAIADRRISNRTYYAWVDHPLTLDVLGAYGPYEDTVRVQDEDVRLFGAEVSPALLNALGARPLLGRLFAPNEAEPGANKVMLLSESLWRDRFSADPAIGGRPVSIHGEPYTIVGVVAADFHFLDQSSRFLTPYTIPRVSTDPALNQRTSAIRAIGLISTGATAPQVEAEGTAAARSVPVTLSTQLLFGRGGPPVVHARSLATDMTGDVKPALLVLTAAVGCLLLIACANVANLVLSRGVARQRELAVRAAIGAGRGRLVRQLLTEGLVLSVGGGVLGLALAWALIRVTPVLAPPRFPRLDGVHLDARVLAYSVLISLGTAFLSGLAPAVRGARLKVVESLRGGDGAIAGGFRGLRARQLRDGLLITESALAVILLVGAVLLARSFVLLTRVDGGYTSDHLLTARVLMPRGTQPEYAGQFIGEVLPRLRATPGIVAAGAGNMMPLSGNIDISTFPITDASGTPIMARALTYIVTPGYAEALGLHLRAGRLFDQRDTAGGPRAMIVSDQFVQQYLPNGPAVGRRFTNLYRQSDNGIVTEIIGVVGATLKEGNDRRPEPEIYFAHGTNGRRIVGSANVVVRTAGDPGMWVSTVREVLRDSDRHAIIERVEPLADPLAASVAQPRFAATVLGSFALVALALASVGLYGVLSYAVSQRRRELAVRAALGASRRALVGLVLREGLTVTGIGTGVGLLGAAAVTRLMQGALFGVTPLDAVSFVAAPLMLVPVAVAACVLPAIRAASVGPADVLRAE